MRLFLFFTAVFFFILPVNVYASEYVLPYPPVMPGSMTYKMRLVVEEVKKIWSFGSIAQYKYNLELSDKYLVQAMVLFDYDQYLLGFQSLQKSNEFYRAALASLAKAKNEGKNMTAQERVFSEAGEKHILVLNELKRKIPAEFLWSPENTVPTNLLLHELIEVSIQVRKVSK